ncbi:hypothetical protein CEXT_435961 [Caerostris extrusa]|uniref:Uncharacterized protein n=1 Tax=Caerostris extrusa TaxID=172846 RepID=A0AAV4UPY6_CAEEX|nr:hypothetical protein CEXT_435961 [Caerostris extrusa]
MSLRSRRISFQPDFIHIASLIRCMHHILCSCYRQPFAFDDHLVPVFVVVETCLPLLTRLRLAQGAGCGHPPLWQAIHGAYQPILCCHHTSEPVRLKFLIQTKSVGVIVEINTQHHFSELLVGHFIPFIKSIFHSNFFEIVQLILKKGDGVFRMRSSKLLI